VVDVHPARRHAALPQQAEELAPAASEVEHVAEAPAKIARYSAGFTLAELAACLAVIALLALLVPATIAHLINDARLTRARRETQALAATIARFIDDAEPGRQIGNSG
jgi:prepilin-type N-terminal cleavage/methylation domain-containing protein